MTRSERARHWAIKNARKERIQCVECDKWYVGDPNEPHVCSGCTND